MRKSCSKCNKGKKECSIEKEDGASHTKGQYRVCGKIRLRLVYHKIRVNEVNDVSTVTNRLFL